MEKNRDLDKNKNQNIVLLLLNACEISTIILCDHRKVQRFVKEEEI